MFGRKAARECNDEALEAAWAAIHSQADFVSFTKLLALNYKKHPKGWENDSLGSFLEALSAYSADAGGFYQNRGEKKDLTTPDWSVFATILMGAKVYE